MKINLNSIFFKISLNSKDPTFELFLPISPFFGTIGSLSPYQNSGKSNDPIPRKHLDRWQDGRTDRPYFIGSFSLPPKGPTITTAEDWNLKVKDI